MKFNECEDNALSTLDQDILAHGLGMYLLKYMDPCPVDFGALRESAATQAIREIHGVLENQDLTDFACVEAITKIIEGIGGRTVRHDF